ncbi:MAG TPA: Stk1 family PASTA domain-containing Ser/Thr kinase [Mycobacteriales bacterium]|nr:Stk1 family PASTA domain-containing Ser/Thr kinase [Mycobacteriales bacterium]
MDTTLADPLLGVVLDRRYRVRAVLAHGGMSTVYTGWDLRLDRPVAIKVMSPSFSTDPAFVRQFGTEARSAARLSHLNVVSVFDQGSDSGHVFLVMELVSGRTLRQLLRERGALAPDLAVSLLEPVLAALAAAHRAGLAHRDVKPENVLLSDTGVVKVADFGLARAVASATSTQSGSVMGTVAYVAPEQVSRGTADARTDVYSAGIMLYELLVGAPPYRGDTAISVAYRHVHEDVPPPSTAVPGIPPELDALVLRATRREPDARPADAAAFAAELRDVRAALGLARVAVPPVLPVPPGPAGAEPVRSDHALNRTRALGTPVGAPVPPPRPGGSAAGRGAAGSPYPDEQRAHRRRGIVALVAVLLLGAAAAGVGWSYGVLHYTRVPVVTGLAQGAATTAMRAGHLRVRPTTSAVFDDRVRAGLVAGSNPGPGKRVARGGDVTLLVSKGPAPRRVPDLSGRDTDDALRALSGLGLGGRLERAFADVDAGQVAGTVPGAGSTARIGSTVTVLVSEGRLPDTTGDSRGKAESRLRSAGLKVRVTENFSDDAPRGKVASQRPSGGTVRPGATVTLVVSRGSQSVQVPNVIGRTVQDARAELEGLGFRVTVHDVLGGPGGRVVAQTPIAGFARQRGSTVRLDVL